MLLIVTKYCWNTFRIIGPLWGEPTHYSGPLTWCFDVLLVVSLNKLWICLEFCAIPFMRRRWNDWSFIHIIAFLKLDGSVVSDDEHLNTNWNDTWYRLPCFDRDILSTPQKRYVVYVPHAKPCCIPFKIWVRTTTSWLGNAFRMTGHLRGHSIYFGTRRVISKFQWSSYYTCAINKLSFRDSCVWFSSYRALHVNELMSWVDTIYRGVAICLNSIHYIHIMLLHYDFYCLVLVTHPRC